MPKKILLADDSITIQKVVELTFSDGDYEVTAVNNGAKAIQKLADMRPDIILSDIIMPEKNGYEVCEYVKSHPEYRNIPVVLLTGTFEPFDPDRAEKAGCDAVVTKPFESQSLIHKVEELIEQARSAALSTVAVPTVAPPPEPEPPPSPWMEETAPTSPPADTASPFTTSGGSFPLPPLDSYTHNADIFSAAAAPEATTEMPFDTPAADSPFGAEPEYSAETRAFTKMSFDEMQQMSAPPPPPPAAPEPEPEPEAESPFGSAFGSAPFGETSNAEEFSGETRAFPRMSFDDLQQMSAPPVPLPPSEPEADTSAAAPEPSPWDEPASEPAPEPASSSPFAAEEPEAPAFGGETRAFPQLNFDDLQAAAPAAPAEASPWDEPEAPAFGGETRAFPKMSFDDLQQMAAPEPEPEPEPRMQYSAPLPEESEDAWSPAADTAEPEPLAAAAMPEDLPFAADTTAPAEVEEEAPMWEPAAEAPALNAPEQTAEAFAEPEEPSVPPAALAPEAPAMPIAARGDGAGDLTDDQVDRIARRVIELMSDHVIRNIAWEVIPDLAEMVVKERIRQLEAEA